MKKPFIKKPMRIGGRKFVQLRAQYDRQKRGRRLHNWE